MELIDGGLEELEVDEEAITIYCEYTDFNNMQMKLEEIGIEIINSELQRIPNNFKNYKCRTSRKSIKIIRFTRRK